MSDINNMKHKSTILKNEIDKLKINVDNFYKLTKETTNQFIYATFVYAVISLNNMIKQHNELLFKISYIERRCNYVK